MSDQAPWVDGLTIDEVLQRTSQRFGDRDALVFPALGKRWSYSQFNREVDRAARGLLGLGLGRGDHVAIWATNVPEWVILQMASARIGAVLVTVNPAYRVRELIYTLQQSDAAALFLVDRFKSSDYHAMLLEACPELQSGSPGKLKCAQFPHLGSVITLGDTRLCGALSWDEMLDGGCAEIPALDLKPGQPVNIQYTSGTTGLPKAALLTHRNLLLNAYYTGKSQRFGPQDRVCIPVPFYHCFGCVLGTLCCLVHGAAMVIPAQYFDPSATLQAIEGEKATAIYGVPTMFIAMLEELKRNPRQTGSLRTGIMAGSPCPMEVMRQVIRSMGAGQMTIAYGLTEASPVLTQTQVDDPIDVRVETVGRAIPGVRIRIVDPLSRAQVEEGQQGELCARGHGVMLGYYKDPQATREAIDEEGWLRTGDLALRRPDGCYSITGRIKDMLIRGGENIYPREIEEFLFTHPAVEQVAAVGLPDPKFGEELCIWIQLCDGQRADAEEIRRFCKSHLAHYKCPRYVRFVKKFPQTVTGKIQKFKIRQQMIAELGLE